MFSIRGSSHHCWSHVGSGALAAAQQDAVRKEAAHQKALDDMQVGAHSSGGPPCRTAALSGGMTAAMFAC